MADQFRLRLSVIEGVYTPELRCPHCGQWLLIDTENWEKNEWHMCLACKRMQAKLYAALRQRDAEYRSKKAVKSRRYREWLRETYPQYLQAYERERKAERRDYARRRRAIVREREGGTLWGFASQHSDQGKGSTA
jgi:hypothetical protein